MLHDCRLVGQSLLLEQNFEAGLRPGMLYDLKNRVFRFLFQFGSRNSDTLKIVGTGIGTNMIHPEPEPKIMKTGTVIGTILIRQKSVPGIEGIQR